MGASFGLESLGGPTLAKPCYIPGGRGSARGWVWHPLASQIDSKIYPEGHLVDFYQKVVYHCVALRYLHIQIVFELIRDVSYGCRY